MAVARINATQTPRLGTLFVNPGGPGDSGVDWVLSDDILIMMEGSGGQYDIVSWDPRGVGDTIPKVQCFASGTEEKTFWNGSIRGDYLELRKDFSDPAVRSEFYSHVPEADKMLIKFGQHCDAESQYKLKYIGTTATVRDMVALHDHLEGTETINYWGISYGTVLGNYFVNMFPDRVGRVVIDGVVNTDLWAARPPLELGYETFNSTDATFDAFASSCLNAGSSKCAIADKGSSANEIYEWVLDLIGLAYDHTKASGGAIITSGKLRAFIWATLYHPKEWPALAQTLAQLYTALEASSSGSTSTTSTTSLHSRALSNVAHLSPLLHRATKVNESDPAIDYAYQAITCADAIDTKNTMTKDGFDMVVNTTQNSSRMLAPLFGWVAGAMYCHRWPTRAVERFTGPFNHTLRNKIVVIGNLDDPVTPFISAKHVADALGDSAVLLKHNGYGHTSIFMRSGCTLAATAKYFTTGEHPAPGTVCEVDQQPFS